MLHLRRVGHPQFTTSDLSKDVHLHGIDKLEALNPRERNVLQLQLDVNIEIASSTNLRI